MATFAEVFVRVAGTNPVVQALVGGIVIAGMNLLGAVLVLVWRDPSERAMDAALGFAAGVMLAASFTSLILPGIEAAGSVVPVIVGIVLGVIVLDRADAWVPHVHVLVTGRFQPEGKSPVKPDGGTGESTTPEASPDAGAASNSGPGRGGDPGVSELDETRVASIVLFIVAITLHNMPEGLAVGVGFGSGNLGDALALMLAIGIQNIPEGLAVSVAAINAGFDRLFYAALTGVRAGLVEIPVAVFGALAVAVAAPLLPHAMGFAAGGMLFVISDEIVPETHARGYERAATLGTMAGVVVMLYLDVVLAAPV